MNAHTTCDNGSSEVGMNMIQQRPTNEHGEHVPTIVAIIPPVPHEAAEFDGSHSIMAELQAFTDAVLWKYGVLTTPPASA